MRILKKIFNIGKKYTKKIIESTITKKSIDHLKKYSALYLSITLIIVLGFLFWQNIVNIFQGTPQIVALDKDVSINILIGALSDKDELMSLYLFSFEPNTRKIGILYFPKNTLLLQISRAGQNKLFTIDELYKKGRWKYLRDSIENDFKIKAPYYLGLKNSDLISIIDLLSGIEMDIDEEIKFYDRYANQWYLIPRGNVNLCGYKISEYLKYDKDIYDEINLIKRKENFVKALFDKLNNLEYLETQENYLKNIYWLITQKNISFNDFCELIYNVKDVKQYDIVLDSAIGGEEHFKDKFGLRISITKAASILPKSFRYKVESLEKSENIIVEILNGTNISGLAERCRKYLQNYEDIDVQIISAARKKDYTNTLIIDRKGNLKSAQRIKDILKIGEIQTDINVSAVVDIRIILGKDIAEILK